MKRRAATVRTPEASSNRMQKAMRDPEILTIGVKQLQVRYSIGYPVAKEAKEAALNKAITKNGSPVRMLSKILGQKRVQQMHTHLVRAETKYPHVFQRIVQGGSLQSVADNYGLQRERIRQIKNEFYEYINDTNSTANKAITTFEHEAGR